LCHFATPLNHQAIDLDSCPNPQKICQVFSCALKKLESFGFFMGGISGVVLALFAEVIRSWALIAKANI